MLRSGISMLSTQHSQMKSNYSVAKSQITSTIDRLTEYEAEKRELKRKLPLLLRILQFFLSLINFILFAIYVALFGFAIALSITAYMEDCLRIPIDNDYTVPERVTPNTISGYNCTGIRMFERNDHFQIALLTLFTLAAGLQMISVNLAFVGSLTLTTKNIKMYLYLFFLSTILLIVFCVFDMSSLSKLWLSTSFKWNICDV